MGNPLDKDQWKYLCYECDHQYFGPKDNRLMDQMPCPKCGVIDDYYELDKCKICNDWCEMTKHVTFGDICDACDTIADSDDTMEYTIKYIKKIRKLEKI